MEKRQVFPKWAIYTALLITISFSEVTNGIRLLTITPRVLIFKARRQAQSVTFTCTHPSDFDTAHSLCLSLQRKGADGEEDYRVISEVCEDRYTPMQDYRSSKNETRLEVMKASQNEYTVAEDQIAGTIMVTKRTPECSESRFTYRCFSHFLTPDSHFPEQMIEKIYFQKGAVSVVSLPTPYAWLVPAKTGFATGDVLQLNCESLLGLEEDSAGQRVKSPVGSKAPRLQWQVLSKEVQWRGVQFVLANTSITSYANTSSCWTILSTSLSLPIPYSCRFRCRYSSNATVTSSVYLDVVVDNVTTAPWLPPDFAITKDGRSFIRESQSWSMGFKPKHDDMADSKETAKATVVAFVICMLVLGVLGVGVYVFLSGHQYTTADVPLDVYPGHTRSPGQIDARKRTENSKCNPKKDSVSEATGDATKKNVRAVKEVRFETIKSASTVAKASARRTLGGTWDLQSELSTLGGKNAVTGDDNIESGSYNTESPDSTIPSVLDLHKEDSTGSINSAARVFAPALASMPVLQLVTGDSQMTLDLSSVDTEHSLKLCFLDQNNERQPKTAVAMEDEQMLMDEEEEEEDEEAEIAKSANKEEKKIKDNDDTGKGKNTSETALTGPAVQEEEGGKMQAVQGLCDLSAPSGVEGSSPDAHGKLAKRGKGYVKVTKLKNGRETF